MDEFVQDFEVFDLGDVTLQHGATLRDAKLAYKTYDAALKIKLGEWQKLGELDWKPWEDFIRRMEGTKLPLDRPMITPDALTRGERIERVYP